MVWFALFVFAAVAGAAVALPVWRSRDTGVNNPPAWAAFAVAGLVFVGAFVAYNRLGQPALADQPITTRTLSAEAELVRMVAQAEMRLFSQPDDAEGWRVIAPVYRRLGRFDDALAAYDRALRWGSFEARAKSDLLVQRAETSLLLSQGVFNDAIKATIAEARGLDPLNVRGGFLDAMQVDSAGDIAVARARWNEFIAAFEATGDQTVELARQRLAMLSDGDGAERAAPPPLSGPTAEQMAAAQTMSDTDRAAMIDGMVSGLAARLEADPSDVAGWVRLIRSYGVLGRDADALEAIVKAREVFADDAAALAQIDAVAGGEHKPK